MKFLTFISGFINLLSLIILATVNPSQAAVITLSPSSLETFGDVILESNQARLTNASLDGFDDLNKFGNPVVFNQSGNHPVFAFDLEFELELEDGKLGFDAGESSGIKQIVTAQAGDILRFDWNFLTNHSRFDSSRNDYAFVSINNLIFQLANTNSLLTPPGKLNFARQTGFQTFSYTFSNSGNYTVGIGVVDVTDDITTSALTIQAIPEPLTFLGTTAAIGFGAIFKRKLNSKA